MIQLIQCTSSTELEDEFKHIYHHSFPSDEIRDWQEMQKLIHHPHFNLYKIIYSNELIGMISIWRWPDLTFIEHFAITESLQGKGIGSKVLKQIIKEVGSSRIVIEVEEAISELASRRIIFYERLSFCSCLEEYHQPPYNPEKKAVKMLLMGYPDAITNAEFDTIKARLYKEVYQTNITQFP